MDFNLLSFYSTNDLTEKMIFQYASEFKKCAKNDLYKIEDFSEQVWAILKKTTPPDALILGLLKPYFILKFVCFVFELRVFENWKKFRKMRKMRKWPLLKLWYLKVELRYWKIKQPPRQQSQNSWICLLFFFYYVAYKTE